MLKQAAGNLYHSVRSNTDPGLRWVFCSLFLISKDLQTIDTHVGIPERSYAPVGTMHEISPLLALRCYSSIAHHGRSRVFARRGRGGVVLKAWGSITKKLLFL
jgi:hypothetical protein